MKLDPTMRDRASDLRAIADGRLMLNVRNGVTVSRSMLARIADEIDALRAVPLAPAEVGGLVDTLRSMSHDDNTRACVSVNSTVSNDLAKKLFDVLHAARKAATALEAQEAELAAVHQRYVDADEARIDAEAQLAEARKALDALDRMSRGVDWCDQDEQARRWSAARRALEGGE